MSLIFSFEWSVGGVLTDVTTAKLSDPTGTFGAKRTDTDATVVADGTDYVNVGTGQYQYEFSSEVAGVEYAYWVEVLYAGQTFRFERTLTAPTTTTDFDQRGSMRSLFRTYTGLSSTNDITDEEINDRLNDFYKNIFVKEVQAENFRLDFNQAVTVDDDGEYSLASDIIEIDGGITFNNEAISQYYERDRFFGEGGQFRSQSSNRNWDFWGSYPDTETYNTAPGLAIGSVDTAKVATDAFNYKIADWTYSVTATETTMTGSTVPQNKYGAWFLSVDSDGDFTVSEASDNATGYSTPGRAVNGLSTTVTNSSVIGFVTAISTDAGGFIPGTTGFDDAAVTDTFTDGDPALRSKPDGCLVKGRKLFIRPKSDDQGNIRARLLLKRPAELTLDTSTVFNEEWGNAIVAGAAVQYLNTISDTDRAAEINGSPIDVGTYQWHLNSIDKEMIIQEDQRSFQRAW